MNTRVDHVIVTGCTGGVLLLLNTLNGTHPTIKAHAGRIKCMATWTQPKSSYVVTGSEDFTVKICEMDGTYSGTISSHRNWLSALVVWEGKIIS